MKTYYSLIFLLFSSLLSAQEFDEEFLRSLPANIRTDFEAQLEKDPELAEVRSDYEHAAHPTA